MIYTDGTHLVADKLKELHEFAKRVGLKQEWFQMHIKHPHYDLTTQRVAKKAIEAGAKVVSSRVVVAVSRRAFNDYCTYGWR